MWLLLLDLVGWNSFIPFCMCRSRPFSFLLFMYVGLLGAMGYHGNRFGPKFRRRYDKSQEFRVLFLSSQSHNHSQKKCAERQRFRNMTAKQLQSRLHVILGVASENKSHIPPIVSHEGNPFPFQVCLPLSLSDWYMLLFFHLAAKAYLGYLFHLQIAIPTPSESWSSMLRRIVDAGGNGGGTVGVAGAGQGGEYP